MTNDELYTAHLFDDPQTLAAIASPAQLERLPRVRELYAYIVQHPDEPDRVFVDYIMEHYSIQRSQAYRDLQLCKQLLPHLAAASRDWHRWKYNQMILDTYRQAKQEGDLKTMERAASSYARFNKIDEEDLAAIPYDQIVIQPFTATDDPSVLGLTPVPHLRERIARLLEKYGADNIDIEDIEAEEPDLEEIK